jgi:hypothetical protein
MRNGECYPQERLAHHTEETDFGYSQPPGKETQPIWATPSGMDSQTSGNSKTTQTTKKYNGTLTDQTIRKPEWPTPQADDGHKAVMTLQTAQRQADKGHQEMLHGAAQIETHHGLQQEATKPDGNNGSTKMDLNPRFIETLMGVPQDWLTNSTSEETDSYQQWQHTHSPNWQLDLE